MSIDVYGLAASHWPTDGSITVAGHRSSPRPTAITHSSAIESMAEDEEINKKRSNDKRGELIISIQSVTVSLWSFVIVSLKLVVG